MGATFGKILSNLKSLGVETVGLRMSPPIIESAEGRLLLAAAVASAGVL